MTPQEQQELFHKVVLPAVIEQLEVEERKSDRRFHVTCHVLAGMNLAAGNIPGWIVCSSISGVYAGVRWFQRRKR